MKASGTPKGVAAANRMNVAWAEKQRARQAALFEEERDAAAIEKLVDDTADREVTAERALAWLADHNRYDLLIKVCREALALVPRRNVA